MLNVNNFIWQFSIFRELISGRQFDEVRIKSEIKMSNQTSRLM